jgi:lipopolysaccharide/colanic/teichoic acid biosynthesis glycosyltransferase
VSVFEIYLPYRLVGGKTYLVPILLAGPAPAFVSASLLFGLSFWSREVWILVLLSAFANTLSLFMTDRIARYPSKESWSIVFFNLMFFTLLLIAILALGRLYYSRLYLLLSVSISTFVQLLYLSFLPLARLALIPGGSTDWLIRSIGRELPPLFDFDEAEGVVADLHHLNPQALLLLANASLQGKPIFHAATVYESYTGRVLLDPGLSEGLFALAGSEREIYLTFKRIWELALIFLFSPILILFFLITAVLVYIDLGFPILFAQERIGQNSKPFRIYKFRTMKGSPRSGVFLADDEDRITPIGRFLRRFRLDELPQFWNILKGEMSLIGPRPEQPSLVEKYTREIPLYPLRHVVSPGITGWAQVQHGYTQGSEETLVKLSYDLYYIKHLSFWLDLRILLRTIVVLITGYGAR